MEIFIGKTAGFCGGVSNAVTKAKEILKGNETIYCLGELVHNEEIIKGLEKMGLITIHDINEAPNNSKVIIRAHGEAPSIYNIAKEKQIEIIDLTCPKVLAIHKQAEQYYKEDYIIIYIAESGHPETVGTMGNIKDKGILVQSEEDIEKIPEGEKYAILAQTTFSMEKFDNIVNIIKKKIKNVEVNKTICNATKIRQDETEKLSKKVDAMIIIGGKKSSNTRKLYDVASKNCKNTFFIQTAQDLKQPLEYEKIGIMAGASTPTHLIEEVCDKIKNKQR